MLVQKLQEEITKYSQLQNQNTEMDEKTILLTSNMSNMCSILISTMNDIMDMVNVAQNTENFHNEDEAMSKEFKLNVKLTDELTTLRSISKSIIKKISNSRKKKDEKIILLLSRLFEKKFNIESIFCNDDMLKLFITAFDHIETKESFSASTNIILNIVRDEKLLKKATDVFEETNYMIVLRAIELCDQFQIEHENVLELINLTSNDERNIPMILRSGSMTFIANNSEIFENQGQIVEQILQKVLNENYRIMIAKYCVPALNSIISSKTRIKINNDDTMKLIKMHLSNAESESNRNSIKKFGISRIYI